MRLRWVVQETYVQLVSACEELTCARLNDPLKRRTFTHPDWLRGGMREESRSRSRRSFEVTK